MQLQSFGANPQAPFRQYDKTDESVEADGYETGLTWPAHWQYVPGGPYYPSEPDDRSARLFHPDWIAYCRLLRHHNAVWIKGWHAGLIAQTGPILKSNGCGTN